MVRRVFTSGLLFVVASASVCAGADIRFNRDVRPILAEKCFHCHGPDAATREADLRLDREDSALRNRDGHVVIRAGAPENSELIRRIRSTDPDLVMPPPGSGRTLTDSEKQTLQQWIQQGAIWEGHWSFIAPVRPPIPSVANPAWPKNVIDHFVLKRLEDEGLRPSPETEKTTWIRRVTFDLTGLPPTLADVDAFLLDDSDHACESVVDRLLQSPALGEHMAAAWLDAARYADTDGYQNDGPRTMHRYRDWVIQALNDNMPFDQFTIEQLAGDLLPNATLSQRIATGFNRNHRYNSEAGLVLEEFLLENAVDRVDTTSTVWMGLTIGCARCHDHKYDPISQREYYQLISFFDNITESGRAIKFGNSEPWVTAPTDDQQTQLDELDAEIREAQKRLRSAIGRVHDFGECVSSVSAAETADVDPDESAIVSQGLRHYFRFEDMRAEHLTVAQGQPVLRSGFRGKSATVGGHGILALGKVGDVACQSRATVSFWLKPEQLQSGVILSRQSHSTTRPGFAVELNDGHLQFYIITRWIAGVGAVETLQTLTADEWVHVALTNDGSQRAGGMQVWLNGKPVATKVLYNTNSNTGATPKTAVLRIGGGVHGDLFQGQLDELRFYDRTLFDDEIALLAQPESVAAILQRKADRRTPPMKDKLRAWIFAALERQSEFVTATPPIRQAAAVAAEFFKLRLQRVELLDSFPTTMVMEEQATARDTHVRMRGIYNVLGDVVASDVPAVFPTLPAKSDNNRHDFARWLVSGSHPLTARVIVNRYWQHFFGTGLVKTSEDFGLQGEIPSHPELLDWLAVEFAESGWNVKALQKLLVMSGTYRQSSRVERGMPQLSLDPDNRLLWRGPRVRLSARELRDQALSVSGLLTPDIGGPSVRPYQPKKLWAEMSNMKYTQSHGKDLYRRGLYTIWKRTVAPPGLAILDAADRESCIVRPKRTNTPLQALTLLNETTFVEAARHLAGRMQREGGSDPVRFVFRVVTAREPNDQEKAMLLEARAAYRRDFAADPENAARLLKTGESPIPKNADAVALAADTMLCNVLLNMDEVISKE